MEKEINIRFPAEWELQSGVQLTWPHENTDWAYILDDAIACFSEIAYEIAEREKLLIVCPNEEQTRQQMLPHTNFKNVIFVEEESNDTWARDHSAISVWVNYQPYIYDFCFNGWGMKFAAGLDNLITRRLYFQHKNIFNERLNYVNQLHYVLEGGSIESDGCGTILTTSECLCSENRNEYKSPEEIEDFLCTVFGAKRILWLNNGYLEGDDTDSHIDTLARFCNKNTIAYVQCTDEEDEHYYDLKLMEDELKSFLTDEDKPYNLIPLPMADAIYEDGRRLPATYANFLIINKAVLMPTYGTDKDEIAKNQLQKAFPDRQIIGIDCRTLVRQNGSLHCVTMQYPNTFLAE